MGDISIPLRLHPSGKTIRADQGVPMMEALANAGIILDAPCGGEGVCGKCRVIVREGAEEPAAAERRLLSESELEAGVRLACQAKVVRPARIEVPELSRLSEFHQILTGAPNHHRPIAIDAAIRKQHVELPAPSRDDDASDHARLERAIGPFEAELRVIGSLPARLREARFCGTAVLAENLLLDFEPGDTRDRSFAVAVDVGTTTLAAALVDLASGEELAVATQLNPQTRFGDDVLTRIQMAAGDGGLARLQSSVLEAIDRLIESLAASAGIQREQIYEVSFAGNTTMQHLLCRLDPRSLGEVPFVPAVRTALRFPARELPLKIHPSGRAYVLPVIGGFVGGDTVAGMLTTDLADQPGPTLLVDVGTNGEIVPSAHRRLYAAAAAAGPAFEGARITHGMRACAGAIERVTFDGTLAIETIGHSAPLGLCGSALIDLAAILLDFQVVSPEGRFRRRSDLPPTTPDDIRQRVSDDPQNLAFQLVPVEQSAAGQAIVLNQRDIRQLQLASGAIRTGIQLLLSRAGIEPGQVAALYLAGGFGNYIRRAKARRIGLIPPSIPDDRIRYCGNTSLAGARLTLLSREKRHEAECLAARTKHIDLAADPQFQWTFADAMIFPNGDQ